MAKTTFKQKVKNSQAYLNDKKNRRRVNWVFWSIVLAPLAVLLLLLLLIGFGAFGKLPTFEELENPRSNLATEIISVDGKNLGNFFIQNRSYVDYKDLSPYLVAALIATEDARFDSHSGIDFPGLARVGVKTVLMGDKGQGGGSTISQQLAKNLYPRDTVRSNAFAKAGKLVVSKLKEWITAVMLEHNYTKEEIVVMYLNTVEYGSNAFGIKSAARTFFNKTPKELLPEEAAMLVGVVNAPSRYSPKTNPERALQRRNTVLGRMSAAGYITEAEAEEYKARPIVLDYHPISHNEGIATYFREMLRLYMTSNEPKRREYQNDWDYEQAMILWEKDPLYGWCNKNVKSDGTPYNLYKDGLKIYTTVDSRMQRYAEEALLEQMRTEAQPKFDLQRKNYKSVFYGIPQKEVDGIMNRAIRQSERFRMMKADGASEEEIMGSFEVPVEMTVFTYNGERDTTLTPRDSVLHYKALMRASFMAMDPTTGYVHAYVGGPNFRYLKYDMVRQGKRQIGSTVKPFIYTFAFDFLGYNPCYLVPNLPVTIEVGGGKSWSPKEASKTEYDGELKPLSWGMAASRNNYSAWIMKQCSPEAVVDMIHKMGITSYIDPVHAVCVGTPEVTLFEMCGAFSVYANRGIHIDPFFVTRIEDKQGNVLSTFSPQSHDAISENTAFTMLGMLKGVAAGGTASRLGYKYGIRGEVGGKTGTTNNNADAWFMGVTPRIVGGAWVGGDEPSIHFIYGGEGAAMALPIYALFLQKVYADKSIGIRPDEKFIEPIGAVHFDCDPGHESAGDELGAGSGEEFFQ